MSGPIKLSFLERRRFGSKDERNYPRIMSPQERMRDNEEYRLAVLNRKRTADLTELIRKLEMERLKK